MLTEYLDVQNMVEDSLQAPNSNSLNEQTMDINGYFAKRKQTRQKNGSLFKFESSTHPAFMNSYLKEHRYSNLTLTVS